MPSFSYRMLNDSSMQNYFLFIHLHRFTFNGINLSKVSLWSVRTNLRIIKKLLSDLFSQSMMFLLKIPKILQRTQTVNMDSELLSNIISSIGSLLSFGTSCKSFENFFNANTVLTWTNFLQNIISIKRGWQISRKLYISSQV